MANRCHQGWSTCTHDICVKVNQLAADLLSIAYVASVPDTFWHTDRRIKAAAETLLADPYEAQEIGRQRAVEIRPDIEETL